MKIFKILLLVLFTATASFGLQGTSSPEDLKSLLEPIRQSHDLPALAGAIVTSKGLQAIGVVGVRKYGAGVPVTINDQFHLGSSPIQVCPPPHTWPVVWRRANLDGTGPWSESF